MIHPRYKTQDDYDAASTFTWVCKHCGRTRETPPPQQYDVDDWDEPPECCGDLMDEQE